MSRVKSKLLMSLAFMYIGSVLVWMSIGDYEKNPAIASFVIFLFSAVFTYGVITLYRDLKLFGWRWIVKTIIEAFK